MEAKTVSASKVSIIHHVMPSETNETGKMHGGEMLKRLDSAAAICAFRHARGQLVTAVIEHMEFIAPVNPGDILNFHLLNSFTAKNNIFGDKQHSEELPEPEDLVIGEPSKDILPMETRKVLCAFLNHYYDDPKVGLIFHKNTNTYELAFDCTPDKFEDHETFREIIQQISWFLPRNYGYCALDEQEKTKEFVSLCPDSLANPKA